MSAKPGTVFLSSVQGNDFDGIRDSAKEAAEQIGWVVKRAEEIPPSPDSSRQTIRRRIQDSEVVISMLGERAGTILDNGKSVVEDEYRMAGELGRPVIVVLQKGVQFDERQAPFVDRVRGEWDKGHWAPKVFGSAADVGLNAIVPALVEFERHGEASAGIAPLAREALETILDSADREPTYRRSDHSRGRKKTWLHGRHQLPHNV